MKSRTSTLRNEKGFTLIEMAIVLVIIGLILGAVIKGKDVLNSAKQKKVYTNFVKTWELSIASYYDRTGNLLGDGPTNGGAAAAKNGVFDNIAGSAFGPIDTRLKQVGLEIPVSNTANSGQYTYTGTYSGSRTITMQLYNLYSHTDLRYRNALYLVGMPTDLAIALDTIIDGEADPTTGTFRSYPDNAYTTWPDASASATYIVNTAYTMNVP